MRCVGGGSCWWNIVKILGTENVKAMTLKFTSFSEEKDCQFAGDVGPGWPIEMWSGEKMDKFGLNTAKSFLGRNVNLHLTDGSVIVNVRLAEIKKDEFRRQSFVTCIPSRNRNTLRIPLKNIAWAELLNLNFFPTGGWMH